MVEVVRTDFHRWPVKLRPGQRVRRTSSTGLTRSYIYPFTSFSPFIVSRRTSGGKKRAQTEEQLDVYSVHLLSLWSRWGLSLGRPSAKQVNENIDVANDRPGRLNTFIGQWLLSFFVLIIQINLIHKVNRLTWPHVCAANDYSNAFSMSSAFESVSCTRLLSTCPFI